MYEWSAQRMQTPWSWLRCLFSPHFPPSLVLYHSGGVDLPFTGWNRGREWSGETQPGLYQDNISGCAGPWGTASARWSTLWGSTAVHLSSSGILPEAITGAVPWDRTMEWEDTCSDTLWPFFMDKMKPWSKAVQCLSDTELSEWLWASSGFASSPDPVVSPGNSPLRYP